MSGIIVGAGTQLHIPAGGLVVAPDGMTVNVELRFETWLHWLVIAHEQCEIADAAERSHGELRAANDDQWFSHLEQEFRASMQCISAQAFAIDALYATVERLLVVKPDRPTPGKRPVARHRWVLETLCRGFKVGPKSRKSLGGYLKSLYEFRDWAVHPPDKFSAPELRADIGSGVEWRFVAFSAENSRNSMSLTMQTFAQLLPLTKDREKCVRDWAETAAKMFVERFPDQTTGTAPTP